MIVRLTNRIITVLTTRWLFVGSRVDTLILSVMVLSPFVVFFLKPSVNNRRVAENDKHFDTNGDVCSSVL